MLAWGRKIGINSNSKDVNFALTCCFGVIESSNISEDWGPRGQSCYDGAGRGRMALPHTAGESA
jgi:hypothetical protein